MFFVCGYVVYFYIVLLVFFEFECCVVGFDDVCIEIFYSGICYFDLYQVCDDWGGLIYLMVLGYEIIGCVIEVGSNVICFKVGDYVGVGCMVDFCCYCDVCQYDLEQYCVEGVIWIYNGCECEIGVLIYGGYFDYVVVEQCFVVKVFDIFDLKVVVLLLCVGIIMWLLLCYWKVGLGQKVGVIGFGGLGYMGVKFVKVFGVYVVMIIIILEKGVDVKCLGVDEVLVLCDVVQMKVYVGSFDFLFNIILVSYDINLYMGLFKCEVIMCLVGVLIELDLLLIGGSVIFGCKYLIGLVIGGMVEIQEMMDFCVEYGIVSDVEMIDIRNVNEVWECMVKNDVCYCFVIDMVMLKNVV